MIDKAQRLQDRIGPEIQAFRHSCLSLQLASLDADGFPHASYAPFVYQNLCYYILISDIAIHGQNLQHNPNVGLMLLEDEADTKDIFARRRLTYTAKAERVERDSDTWQHITQLMQQRAGATCNTLCELQDFKLYCLRPITGRYVKGFGKAFVIDADELPGVTALSDGHVSSLKSGRRAG